MGSISSGCADSWAFADALAALDELGHPSVTDDLVARWFDVDRDVLIRAGISLTRRTAAPRRRGGSRLPAPSASSLHAWLLRLRRRIPRRGS